MSGKVMGEVFELALPLKPKIVLLKYADNSDEHGRNAWPSIATVAARCSLSVRTTRRIIVGLKHLGILEVDGKGYGGRKVHPKGRSYCINLECARRIDEAAWVAAYRASNEWAKTSSTRVDNVSEEEGCPLGDKRCPPEWPLTLSTMADDKPSEPSFEPGAKAAPSQAPALAPGTRIPASWEDYRERVVKVLGNDAWHKWLCMLEVQRDTGRALHLLAPSHVMANRIRDDHGAALAKILDRKIQINVGAKR